MIIVIHTHGEIVGRAFCEMLKFIHKKRQWEGELPSEKLYKCGAPTKNCMSNLIKNYTMRTLESAAALVNANTAIKSKKGNRKSLFHELLLNKEIDRDTVINQIAITLEAEGEPLSDEKFMELRTSVAKSVANFCSESYKPTTAKATYNYDSDYAEYELKRDGNVLSITLREK